MFNYYVSVSFIGVNVLAYLLGMGILALVALVLIVWPPSAKVRKELPVDHVTQIRLLLGEDPEAISADLEKKEENTEKQSEVFPLY